MGDNVETCVRQIVGEYGPDIATKKMVRKAYQERKGMASLSREERNTINFYLEKIIQELITQKTIQSDWPPSLSRRQSFSKSIESNNQSVNQNGSDSPLPQPVSKNQAFSLVNDGLENVQDLSTHHHQELDNSSIQNCNKKVFKLMSSSLDACDTFKTGERIKGKIPVKASNNIFEIISQTGFFHKVAGNGKESRLAKMRPHFNRRDKRASVSKGHLGIRKTSNSTDSESNHDVFKILKRPKKLSAEVVRKAILDSDSESDCRKHFLVESDSDFQLENMIQPSISKSDSESDFDQTAVSKLSFQQVCAGKSLKENVNRKKKIHSNFEPPRKIRKPLSINSEFEYDDDIQRQLISGKNRDIPGLDEKPVDCSSDSDHCPSDATSICFSPRNPRLNKSCDKENDFSFSPLLIKRKKKAIIISESEAEDCEKEPERQRRETHSVGSEVEYDDDIQSQAISVKRRNTPTPDEKSVGCTYISDGDHYPSDTTSVCSSPGKPRLNKSCDKENSFSVSPSIVKHKKEAIIISESEGEDCDSTIKNCHEVLSDVGRGRNWISDYDEPSSENQEGDGTLTNIDTDEDTFVLEKEQNSHEDMDIRTKDCAESENTLVLCKDTESIDFGSKDCSLFSKSRSNFKDHVTEDHLVKRRNCSPRGKQSQGHNKFTTEFISSHEDDSEIICVSSDDSLHRLLDSNYKSHQRYKKQLSTDSGSKYDLQNEKEPLIESDGKDDEVLSPKNKGRLRSIDKRKFHISNSPGLVQGKAQRLKTPTVVLSRLKLDNKQYLLASLKNERQLSMGKETTSDESDSEDGFDQRRASRVRYQEICVEKNKREPQKANVNNFKSQDEGRIEVDSSFGRDIEEISYHIHDNLNQLEHQKLNTSYDEKSVFCSGREAKDGDSLITSSTQTSSRRRKRRHKVRIETDSSFGRDIQEITYHILDNSDKLEHLEQMLAVKKKTKSNKAKGFLAKQRERPPNGKKDMHVHFRHTSRKKTSNGHLNESCSMESDSVSPITNSRHKKVEFVHGSEDSSMPDSDREYTLPHKRVKGNASSSPLFISNQDSDVPPCAVQTASFLTDNDDSSDCAEQKETKVTKDNETSDPKHDRELGNLRKICRHVGLILRNTIELRGCDSSLDKVVRIRALLKMRGMKGEPSMKSAQQFLLEKELKDLGGTVIQENECRGSRSRSALEKKDATERSDELLRSHHTAEFSHLNDIFTIDDSSD